MNSTSHYVGKFKLDQENFEFQREELLKDLSLDFLELIEKEKITSKGTKDGFTYQKFKNCVNQIETKFWAISNKKIGLPFTKKLWSAFFAIYLSKLRGELFPEVQALLDQKKLEQDNAINK